MAQAYRRAAMKRAGQLWPWLTAWTNLWTAACNAARGKRSRPDVLEYLLHFELNIVRLRRALEEGRYRPGPYRTFVIREPKQRIISAAPFADRVVHHALTQIIAPEFEERFTVNSYACREGYGTHRALDDAAAACERFPYVLKCDVRKYFPSIDHDILVDLLARVIKCRRTLDLAALIVDSSNPQEPADFYFPGDDLFAPFERRRGLPLGNQTSQFFANVYLDPLDHFVVRRIQPGAYLRYVDDFLLFGNDKAFLNDAHRRIEDFLVDYRLRLHDRKSRVYRTADGVTFLGWRLFPTHRRLVRSNVVAFRRRLREMGDDFQNGRMTWEQVRERVNAWIGHAKHGATWKLRQQVFDSLPFLFSQRKK